MPLLLHADITDSAFYNVLLRWEVLEMMTPSGADTGFDSATRGVVAVALAAATDDLRRPRFTSRSPRAPQPGRPDASRGLPAACLEDDFLGLAGAQEISLHSL